MARNLKIRKMFIFVDDEGATQDPHYEDEVAFDSYTEGALFWDVEDTSTYHIAFPPGMTAVAIEIHNTSATAELIVAYNCGDTASLGAGARDMKTMPTGPADDTPVFRVDVYPFDTYEEPITMSYRVFGRVSA